MRIELSRDEHLIIMDSLLHNYSDAKTQEHTDEEEIIEIIDKDLIAKLYIKLLNY